MTARYQLTLLGGCKLVDSQLASAVEFRSRKSRCLLGLLALWPGAVMSREKIASFLWDPAPEEQARSSLRQCLKEIRETLGDNADQLLHSSRLEIHMQLDHLNTDVAELQSNLIAARSNSALALKLAGLWQGELFGDMVPPAPVFEAWVQVERARLRGLISGVLTDHLQTMIATRNYAVPAIAEELVRIEPSHELAYQYLMRYHAARGDQAGALRQYARLGQVLADELDSEPSQETIDLLVAIKRGDSFGGAAPAGPAPFKARAPENRGGVPRIAIRPPLTHGSDGKLDYLAEGFANLLRVCMARFRSWIVLPWPNQGFDSKTRLDFPALGQAIGVDYVIDAAFDWRQTNGQLVVSLIDCGDGSQVWTEIYPVAEPDIQSVSSTVVGRLSSRLASRVDHMSLLRFARTAPADAAAYDLWLRGHQLSRSWEIEADAEARALFAQAIDRDPGLACAYSSLATMIMTQSMIRPGYPFSEADARKCFELAQKAVSLDPFDSRNHLSMAWIWLMRGSVGRSESHFRLATEINPFDSETLMSCALGAAFIGDLASAQSWAKTSFELNPLHPEYYCAYQATICFLAGDYKETLAWYARCDGFFPDAWAWIASANALLANISGARHALESFTELVAKSWEGPAPPTWTDMHSWLESSIPIHWRPGRQAFYAGIEKARACLDTPPDP